MRAVWVNAEGKDWSVERTAGGEEPDAIIRHISELPAAIAALA
jgi:FMN phosphatase YigB (HAD superfamily)